MIPTFDKLILPILRFAQHGAEFHRFEPIDEIIKHFNLEDFVQDSDNLQTLKSRMAFAYAYLKNAYALDNVNRGYYKINERGLKILQLNPSSIPNSWWCENFPDLRETRFYNPLLREKEDKESNSFLDNSSSLPNIAPEESIKNSLQFFKNSVLQDLSERIQVLTPRQFESLVVDLLIVMGYGKREHSFATEYTKDGGIDGVVSVDEFGFSKIYVQAKLYKSGNMISRPAVQQFIGSMKNVQNGVFITTSKFTKEAIQCAKEDSKNIALIDGEMITEFMYQYGHGINIINTFEIKSVNYDYFDNL